MRLESFNDVRHQYRCSKIPSHPVFHRVILTLESLEYTYKRALTHLNVVDNAIQILLIWVTRETHISYPVVSRVSHKYITQRVTSHLP